MGSPQKSLRELQDFLFAFPCFVPRRSPIRIMCARSRPRHRDAWEITGVHPSDSVSRVPLPPRKSNPTMGPPQKSLRELQDFLFAFPCFVPRRPFGFCEFDLGLATGMLGKQRDFPLVFLCSTSSLLPGSRRKRFRVELWASGPGQHR